MLEIIKNAQRLDLIELRIVEWGRWIRHGSRCEVGNGVNPIYAMMQKAACSSGPSLLISDDEAEFIGEAVMVLKRAKPELGEAIVNYYAVHAKTNLTTLARDLGCCRTVATQRLDAALYWLQGYFSGMLQKCA